MGPILVSDYTLQTSSPVYRCQKYGVLVTSGRKYQNLCAGRVGHILGKAMPESHFLIEKRTKIHSLVARPPKEGGTPK